MIDAEELIVAWLTQDFPTARVGTETPGDLAAACPFIRPARVGGADRLGRLDHVRVSVESFALSKGVPNGRADARALAEQIRDSIVRDLPGQTVNGAQVTRSQCNTAPTVQPYENTDVRMATGLYEFWLLPV